MKKILFIFAAACVSLLCSCNEELEIDKVAHIEPAITSFSPVSGVAGSEIVVEGVDLQNITKAYIGDVEVLLKSRVSDKLLTVEASSNAMSGVLKLAWGSDPDDCIETVELFTYEYLTPSITTALADLTPGDVLCLEGENLTAVKEIVVTPNDTSVAPAVITKFDTTPSQIMFSVPLVAEGNATLSLAYNTAAGEKRVDTPNIYINEAPIIVSTDFSAATYKFGEVVTVEGVGLVVVDKVTVNGIEQTIFGTPEANSVSFMLVDDEAFADGLNTCDLVFSAGVEDTFITNEFKFTMPKFYYYSDKVMEGRDLPNNVLRLKDGAQFDAAMIVEDNTYDPISKLNGYLTYTAVTTAENTTNQLISAVTAEDYYSIEPYILTSSAFSSGIRLIGPQGYGKLFAHHKTGLAYGTPTVLMVVLDPANEAEAAIINKVVSGTFTDADFDPATFKALGFTSAKGTIGAPGDVGSAFAPGSPGSTTAHDADYDTVTLLMHMAPSWGDTYTFSMDNVYRFGMLHVTHLKYVASDNGDAAITVNSYWQRTPNFDNGL